MRPKIRGKVLLLSILPALLLAIILSGLSVAILHRLADEQVKETRERLVADQDGGTINGHGACVSISRAAAIIAPPTGAQRA